MRYAILISIAIVGLIIYLFAPTDVKGWQVGSLPNIERVIS